MEDMFYVVQDSRSMRVIPRSEMMFTSPEDVWFSGSEIECNKFIEDLVNSQEPDCDNNGGNCDDYLLDAYSDPYND